MEGVSVEKRIKTLYSVYNMLVNLDKDFARTKKSRTAFINERFGGSFENGSVILLDYIGGDYTDAEDIKKLSFVRDTVSKLEANWEQLNALKNFKFETKSNIDHLFELLSTGEFGVYGPVPVREGSVPSGQHYSVTSKETLFVPKAACTKLTLFSNPMVQWARLVTGQAEQLEVGDKMEVKNGRLCLSK